MVVRQHYLSRLQKGALVLENGMNLTLAADCFDDLTRRLKKHVLPIFYARNLALGLLETLGHFNLSSVASEIRTTTRWPKALSARRNIAPRLL